MPSPMSFLDRISNSRPALTTVWLDCQLGNITYYAYFALGAAITAFPRSPSYRCSPHLVDSKYQAPHYPDFARLQSHEP